ncbi:4Fe-4S binding protein [Desulfoplanes formicivorans]|nr:4Fe-4S binding protein [Desulfoplanes formicivorans]
MSLSLARRCVQAGFVLFCLWVGWRFYGFYLWLTGALAVMVPRPPSVEAFLPISGLLGFKSFVLTGEFDPIHPAGLVILLAAVGSALVFRRAFCGYVCPIGCLFDAVHRLSSRFLPCPTLPSWLDLGLRGLKYLVLLFFLGTIFGAMSLQAVQGFLHSPYNMLADVNMLEFFLDPSSLFLVVLGILVVASMFIPRFWCRYLCPYGALVEGVSWASPLAVHRRPDQCVHCGQCSRVCPEAIRVDIKERVSSPACMLCMRCVESCPAPNALDIRAVSRWRVSGYWIPLGMVAVFLLAWITALASGHWHTQVSPDMVRMLVEKG